MSKDSWGNFIFFTLEKKDEKYCNCSFLAFLEMHAAVHKTQQSARMLECSAQPLMIAGACMVLLAAEDAMQALECFTEGGQPVPPHQANHVLGCLSVRA